MVGFAKAYIKSMRLYYAFVTGISGWIGVAFYEYIANSQLSTVEIAPSVIKKGIILILLFLSWGLNQIINDYLGLKEDKINAPERPMVSGELDPSKAMILSGFLLTCSIIITCLFLQPIAIVPALLGILLNVIYEYAKGYGILGNIVFGLMISMCTVFGFLAAGPIASPYFTSGRISIVLLVVAINGLMTFYTYFKDYKGDKATNKKTIVVRFGIENSKIISIILALLPSIMFVIIYLCGFIETGVNNIFIILAILTLFLHMWTGFLYYKNPIGEKTYYSLKTNFRACACGQAALIALFNTELAMLLFLISYIFIGFLFDLHSNSKA